MISVYDKNTTDFTMNGLMILQLIHGVQSDDLFGVHEINGSVELTDLTIKSVICGNIIKIDNTKYRITQLEIDETLLLLIFTAEHIGLDLLKVPVPVDFNAQGLDNLDTFDLLKAIIPNPSKIVDVYVERIDNTNINISVNNTNYLAILTEIARQSNRYLEFNDDKLRLSKWDTYAEEIHYKRNIKAFKYTLDYRNQIDKIQAIGYNPAGSERRRPWIGTGLRGIIKEYSDIKVGEYYNSELITYGNIDSILDNLATEYLNKHSEPEIHVDVDFVVLSNLEQFKDLELQDKYNVGQRTKIKHSLFEIDLQIVRVDYDIINKKYLNIETGKILDIL